MSNLTSNRKRLSDLFIWLTILMGGLAYVLSAYRVDLRLLDLKFVTIAILTLLLSSRIVIPIPGFSSHISASETFIFLTLLLFGGEAAVLIAGTEALLSSFRFSRKPRTILFNSGCAACSTFITAKVLENFFADMVTLQRGILSPRFVVALTVMALIQYVSNSGIIATRLALRSKQPIWKTWKKQYVWTSVTYFAGAFAAAVIAELMVQGGFFAVVITLPVIATVFLTYRSYLKNIEAAASKAQQAEQHVFELSQYIAEQQRIREQFTQVEKLSALGEFASGVAHDFNNTLAGILGRAQLLLRTNDPEKITRGLNIIIRTAEDGAKTVKRIQDFARQRRDHDFEPVSLDQILFDVSEITRPRWKDKAEAAGIHISLDMQIRSKWKVMGDESELREVLVNMVLNAVDAMPMGGRLTLSAEDVDDSVVISIADTGSGMAPEIRSRIFDPFFTTKGKAGMGLGLAVGFGIIRRHEGTITVQSDVTQGTTFRISLPVAKADDGSLMTAAAPELSGSNDHLINPVNEAHNNNQLRMLVVDDEECVRDLLRELLESEGCTVSIAAGGREALALFESREFDAVFTDVGMPGMSGWELARAIRQLSKGTPIAVITGWGEAVGSIEQKEADVNWVIAKPFTAERIFELVREIIDRRGVEDNKPTLSIVAA
jgi:signal transduction histidine kinase/ActR/RegA family two-component response regulator